MAQIFLDFLTASAIDVSVMNGEMPDGYNLARYTVTLTRNGTCENFTILGTPETALQLTREDAARALHIRASMHENRAALSGDTETLCRETAGRLKELLGPSAYRNFLVLQDNAGTSPRRRSLFSRLFCDRSLEIQRNKTSLETVASTR